MSEYQHYQWKRLGRKLSSSEREEVLNLSSHISVASDSAEVTYHFGDFKHDPLVVLSQYFDIFLYEANWGTQRLGFKFPADAVDIDLLKGYSVRDTIEVSQKSGFVFVEVWFDENWVQPSYYGNPYEDDSDWRLEAFAKIYRQIRRGDFRGLFILWLKGARLSAELKSEVFLPKGMKKMGEEHRIFADFFGVEESLIQQAAKQSQALPSSRKINEELENEFSNLSDEEQRGYLKRLLVEDSGSVQSALLQELDKRRNSNYLSGTVKFEELRQAEEEQLKQELLKAEEEKQERRANYLIELGSRENEILTRVHQLILEKDTKSYDEAVMLLRGLEDLSVSRGDRDELLNRVKGLVEEFPRLTGLRSRFEKAGWIAPKTPTEYTQMYIESWQKKNPLEREIDFGRLR